MGHVLAFLIILHRTELVPSRRTFWFTPLKTAQSLTKWMEHNGIAIGHSGNDGAFMQTYILSIFGKQIGVRLHLTNVVCLKRVEEDAFELRHIVAVQFRQPPFFLNQDIFFVYPKSHLNTQATIEREKKPKHKKRNNKTGTLMLEGFLEGTSTNISDPHGWQQPQV